MVWLTKPPLGTQLDWTHPLNQGLAGFWLFNEGMGDKVYDLSGNNNTGTLTGMAFPSTPTSGWNPGRTGPTIVFDSINDYIACGNLIGFDPLQSITISALVNFNSIETNERHVIGSRSLSTSTNTISLGGWNGSIRFLTMNGVRYVAYPASGNNWIHILGEREVSGTQEILRLYVNNILVDSSTYTSLSIIPNSWSIGRLGETTDYYHNGIIDECRIWNRLLSNTEKLQLYTTPYSMFQECSPIICNLTFS